MNLKLLAVVVGIVVGVTDVRGAPAVNSDVVIGDIDDLSGPYADIGGAGDAEAMKMAIADFGGSVLGRNIVTLVADHQHKPDIGASKFREWVDQAGLNVLLMGGNTGVAIAMAKVAATKKVVFFAVGPAGASLTNEDCTAWLLSAG